MYKIKRMLPFVRCLALLNLIDLSRARDSIRRLFEQHRSEAKRRRLRAGRKIRREIDELLHELEIHLRRCRNAGCALFGVLTLFRREQGAELVHDL